MKCIVSVFHQGRYAEQGVSQGETTAHVLPGEIHLFKSFRPFHNSLEPCSHRDYHYVLLLDERRAALYRPLYA